MSDERSLYGVQGSTGSGGPPGVVCRSTRPRPDPPGLRGDGSFGLYTRDMKEGYTNMSICKKQFL